MEKFAANLDEKVIDEEVIDEKVTQRFLCHGSGGLASMFTILELYVHNFRIHIFIILEFYINNYRTLYSQFHHNSIFNIITQFLNQYNKIVNIEFKNCEY